jgi:hypothetical protein
MSHSPFTNKQIADLHKIKDDPAFIEISEHLVLDQLEYEEESSYSAKKVKQINSELKRVENALKKLSKEARFMLNYQSKIRLFDDAAYWMTCATWDEILDESQRRNPHDITWNEASKIVFTDPVQDILDGLSSLEPYKGLTRLQQIGDDALHIFYIYKIKPGTAFRSNFVNYLSIILDASGLLEEGGHNAQKLARDTKKRVTNLNRN